MPCSCKKRNQAQPAATPAPISIKMVEVHETTQNGLNDNQVNLINQIVDKINQNN